MNKIILLVSLLLSILTSCSNNSAGEEKVQFYNKNLSDFDVQQVDTTYMHTGFYFLADKGTIGVKMKIEGLDEFYSLAKEPFASVTNIKRTELKIPKDAALCLIFDEKGTRDLEEGTGNPLHSKIAVVIAGKLVYVVDNTTKIKTGIMCVILDGYTKDEMVKTKIAVDQKQ